MSSTILTHRIPSAPNIKIKRPNTPNISSFKAIIIAKPPPGHLKSFDQLPGWYQDNPWVLTHYRPVSRSYFSCLNSLTYLHNETINIYTHLIPAVLTLLALPFINRLISEHFPDATLTDRSIFLLNLFAAAVTATLSATYHTLTNHSRYISFLALRIDYAGILLLIHCSFVSGIYVGFYCEPLIQYIHWSSITILSLVTAVLVLDPRFQGVTYRLFKTLAFVLTALSGFAPITHGLLIYGWDEMWIRSGMPYWFLEGAVYLVGSIFFATRFPECCWPGTFDLWGGSHQIFHVFVVGGAAVHLLGVWEAWRWNHQNLGGCRVG